MNCPRCNTELERSTREGIEVDVCPSCRGVWLDRGELDKIIERSEHEEGARGGRAAPTYAPPPTPGELENVPPIFGRPNFPPTPAGPADVPGQGDPGAVPGAVSHGHRRRSLWREVLDF